MKTCKKCGEAFNGVKTQRYCSLECALWSRVSIGDVDECWPWIGATAPGGYGSFRFDGKAYRANRVALAVTVGESRLDALHLCDNPSCCNPNHLMWGDHKENMRQANERNRIMRSHSERHWKATLTDEQAREAKQRLSIGHRQIDIAADLGVGRMVITDIKRGIAYRHVEV